LFIASGLRRRPQGVEGELLVVIAALAPGGHLSTLPGGDGGWQSGRLECIASRLADRPQTLNAGADASPGRPFPSPGGQRQPPLVGVAVGGSVAAVGIAGVAAGEEALVALLEPQLALRAGVQRAPGGLVRGVL
jgi:hypothetical protein